VTAPLDGSAPRLFARHFRGTIHAAEVITALRYLRRRIGQPLLIVWDHLSAHRAKEVSHFLARHPEDFRVEWLPGYAPELNPEEQCNNCVKLAMLNAQPETDLELLSMARTQFKRLARKGDMLRKFFTHAGLSLSP
jgi:transposase